MPWPRPVPSVRWGRRPLSTRLSPACRPRRPAEATRLSVGAVDPAARHRPACPVQVERAGGSVVEDRDPRHRQFAALLRTDVASRYRADGVTAHRFAGGDPSGGRAGGPPAELRACWTAIRRSTRSMPGVRRTPLAGTLHPPDGRRGAMYRLAVTPSPLTAKSWKGFSTAPSR